MLLLTSLQYCSSANWGIKCLPSLSIFLFDIMSRIIQIKIVKLPSQAPLAFYYRIDLILYGSFKSISFPSLHGWQCYYISIEYPHLLLSPSHFQNSLSTFSVERVNGIPLWDFYPRDFQRALKITMIAELFIVITISQGKERHNNSDNAEKCSFTIVRP